MTVQPGDVFAHWIPEISAYSACQITHIKDGSRRNEVMFAVLALNWQGPEQPTLAQLQDVNPLRVNFYFWNNRLEHSYTQGPIPRDYIPLGNLPVRITAEPRSYGDWSSGFYFARQLAWEQIPLHQREAFHRAANEDAQVPVEIDGHTFVRGQRSLYLNEYPQWRDYARLREFPCLTELHVSSCPPELLRYLRTNPFIYKINIEHPTGSLDFTGTAITQMTINLSDVESLILPKDQDMLIVQGEIPPTARIYHPQDGVGITLYYHLQNDRPFLPFSGLHALSGLDLNAIDSLDAGIVVDRFPHLKQLVLRGTPGYLQHAEELGKLSQLQELEVYDLFGYSSEVFTSAEQWPHLQRLWLSSLPEEVAKQIKLTYKSAAKAGLDLSVRQPRKPEWLKDNLDNPFRSWDGMAGITSAQARKAADLFRKVSAGFRLLLTACEEAPAATLILDEVQDQVIALLKTYIEGFNKLDRRTGFIYTVEREEILGALQPILAEHLPKLAACGITLDENTLWEQIDHWRDW